MRYLEDILAQVKVKNSIGPIDDVQITDIQFDSRKVTETSVFVAVKGFTADGHDYIPQVEEKGVKAFVVSTLPAQLKDGVVYIEVENTGKALGQMASEFYDNPSAEMKVVGVTGTNGKTTVATLLYNLFRELGYSVGLISTVENIINGEVIPSTHTTPDAVSVQVLMKQMFDKGCTHCFMEVSSHALHQDRISGVDFDGALFTNISHDHLDYHKTFDEYIKVKKKFFDDLSKDAFSIVNIDDKRGRVMVQNTISEVHTYGLKALSDFKGKIISNTIQGLELEVNNVPVWFRLLGEFNAYNLILVFGAATLLGESEEEVLQVLSMLAPANGRFEQYPGPNKMIGVVDYAHTPDALENVLKTLQALREGNENIITVVGCGGNRDKDKRPVMGNIAAKYSDRVIFTSDNPRNEDPAVILEEINAGVTISYKKKVLTIADRREAIKTGVMLAAEGDIILVAGKGHETYQDIKGVKHPFDDKKELQEVFKLMN